MAFTTREQRHDIQKQARDTVKDLHDKTETIQGVKGDKLRARYQLIKEQVEKLTDEKGELFSLPVCRAELLELAKNEYKKNRQEFAIQGLLREHLAGCQGNRCYPFDPATARVGLVTESNVWRLLFLVFTEKDIEEVVATLPDIGISADEREKRMREIDKQIEKLLSQVEKDLKEI